jgi:hypothetical protein
MYLLFGGRRHESVYLGEYSSKRELKTVVEKSLYDWFQVIKTVHTIVDTGMKSKILERLGLEEI